jgi:hypothetical protein
VGPQQTEVWSLTRLCEKRVQIGAKVIWHGRYTIFEMAEIVIPRNPFADILRRNDRLRPEPKPT